MQSRGVKEGLTKRSLSRRGTLRAPRRCPQKGPVFTEYGASLILASERGAHHVDEATFRQTLLEQRADVAALLGEGRLGLDEDVAREVRQAVRAVHVLPRARPLLRGE